MRAQTSAGRGAGQRALGPGGSTCLERVRKRAFMQLVRVLPYCVDERPVHVCNVVTASASKVKKLSVPGERLHAPPPAVALCFASMSTYRMCTTAAALQQRWRKQLLSLARFWRSANWQPLWIVLSPPAGAVRALVRRERLGWVLRRKRWTDVRLIGGGVDGIKCKR